MDLLLFECIVIGVSILAGTIGALVGLGGGIIITPFLVLCFGIDIRYAMGAALTSVIATSSGAAISYVKDGISNIKISMFLSIATTIGAVSGAFIAMMISKNLLSIFFGIALLLTALLSLMKKPKVENMTSTPLAIKLQLPGTYQADRKTHAYPVVGVIPGFIVMWIAGVLSGLLGIGSGAFKVLGMDQIMKIPFRVTTATSNFMIGITAAASVGIYLKAGYIEPLFAAPVALGVLFGAFIGARLLQVVPVNILKMIFLIAISIISIQMIVRGVGISL
ncbi:sulfite exporter TauE/SafE family protein [Thiotrichales bacterium 19S3-7]|nr:sulfite exporter TauE/SafE family protein [Thiotrichales bacterium 19S3-7]MCF6802960.1 sulfite exporter TauE/SafE family protein [Thiotrichales bacterium 19S3-11]